MPRKIFTAGEVLAAGDVNTFLMDQSVMTFADSTARASAIGTASQGMVTYLEDVDELQVFNGTDFVEVGGAAPAVLQVKSTTKTDVFSASLASGASTAITGLTSVITPASATNKVLVTADVQFAITVNFIYNGFTLTRNGSAIAIGDADGSRQRLTAGMGVDGNSAFDAGRVSFSFLDTPATTSSTTYGVNIFNQAGGTRTVYVNRNNTDTNALNDSFRSTSTITVMEVAG